MQLDVNFIRRGHWQKLTKLCDDSEDDDVKPKAAKRLPITTFGQKKRIMVELYGLWNCGGLVGTLLTFASGCPDVPVVSF